MIRLILVDMVQLEVGEEAEVLAAEGMTQLAASPSAPASSSFNNVADISPLLALGRSLILMSNQIPQEVHSGLCLLIPTADYLACACANAASASSTSLVKGGMAIC